MTAAPTWRSSTKPWHGSIGQTRLASKWGATLLAVQQGRIASPKRTNEFGVRMALGATPANVLRLVFASTVGQVNGGVVCGILLSLLIGRVLSKWDEGSVQDPLVFTAVTLLLVMTAAPAAFVPARRAASVDPVVALRYE